MSCFGCGESQTHSPPSSPKSNTMNCQQYRETNQIQRDILLQIPGCVANLVEEGEAIELARGDFSLILISDQNVPLATIIKVGDHLQWPITKDEPVVKLDDLHYLFTLPVKERESLNYGVTFTDRRDRSLLASLDTFLRSHSCFSLSSKHKGGNDLDWKEFAPQVEAYNNFLARAIAQGTGHIVKGIFMCSNTYTNQVHKGGEQILTPTTEEKSSKNGKITASKSNLAAKNNAINQSIKRARTLSDATEKMSRTMLNGVGIATGSVMGPLVRSKQGRAFLSMMPGEVLLASLDAVDRIINAAEAAEKQTLRATSGAAGRMVSNRFGENAGEATEDVLATAGHVAGTAWNVFKLRRALNPVGSTSSGVIKSTGRSMIKS